jgi:hypothetical protein
MIEMTKADESRARRAARRAGLIAVKSRARIGTADNHGGFQLLDTSNRIVAGVHLDLDADAVIEECNRYQ